MHRTQEMKLSSTRRSRLTITAAALTQRGEKRPVNEDAVYHRSGQIETGLSAGLYMVCDGLGACRAGEVASRLVVEAVTRELTGLFPNNSSAERHTPLSPSRVNEWLHFAITQSNTHLRRYAESHWHDAGGLGSTITSALLYGPTAHIANVGDSRIYIARAGKITQVTRDHSLAARLAQAGLIEDSEIATHPHRHLLYRSLGSQATVDVDMVQWKLAPDDKLLLCSDGLWTAFPDEAELAHWLSRPTAPDELCRQLVSEANRRDGADDISAIVIHAA